MQTDGVGNWEHCERVSGCSLVCAWAPALFPHFTGVSWKWCAEVKLRWNGFWHWISVPQDEPSSVVLRMKNPECLGSSVEVCRSSSASSSPRKGQLGSVLTFV